MTMSLKWKMTKYQIPKMDENKLELEEDDDGLFDMDEEVV